MQKLLLGALLAVLGTSVHAQWLHYPTPGIPRTRDGKPNLSAPAPRAADGKPDLSGLWHVEPTPLAEMKRLFGANIDAVSVPGMEPDTISKVEITIDDAEMYTRPFSIKVTHLLQPDTDILEYFCNENEKDRGHMGLK
jgi:hypothetical protein